MTFSDYYKLTVSNLTPAEAEIVSELAFAAGASGIEEKLAFEQKNREYEPVTLHKDLTELYIYFLDRPNIDFLHNLQITFRQSFCSLVGEKNRDWLEEWQKSFQPFCLTSEVWVVPSWSEIPHEAKHVIRIDPGMAFGTGTHETTRLAASILKDYSSGGTTLLDVGTGTGILAMLAERLGFMQIVANDNDPEARRVARENLLINKTAFISVVDEDVSCIHGTYSWVVANIIDGVLVKLQDDLRSRVAPKGYLLLTGILSDRDKIFRSEFSFAEFNLIDRRELGEWVGYLLKRQS
ncbi:MAG: hypothetical protein A2Z20_05845 [Bdellovibrionales bacterium RBG_16_40_8]|nr:MAG: hypothetical protein A2Z20_05845 [Bdellovibrionales bacterium RBG_16_40_8]